MRRDPTRSNVIQRDPSRAEPSGSKPSDATQSSHANTRDRSAASVSVCLIKWTHGCSSERPTRKAARATSGLEIVAAICSQTLAQAGHTKVLQGRFASHLYQSNNNNDGGGDDCVCVRLSVCRRCRRVAGRSVCFSRLARCDPVRARLWELCSTASVLHTAIQGDQASERSTSSSLCPLSCPLCSSRRFADEPADDLVCMPASRL